MPPPEDWREKERDVSNNKQKCIEEIQAVLDKYKMDMYPGEDDGVLIGSKSLDLADRCLMQPWEDR